MELAVYDLRGRRVFVLRSGNRTEGSHFVEWDARDTDGRRLPAGVYFLQLRQGDSTWSKKIAVLE